MLNMTHILIIDDHPLFLAGVKQILKHSLPGVVITSCTTFNEALTLSLDTRFDIVLLDLNLPDKHGIEALKSLLHHTPDRPVAILTASEEKQDLEQAIKSGAKGYIPKTTSPDKITPIIQQIIDGHCYFPELNEATSNSLADAYDLTARQIEILKLIAEGYSNKGIAEQLFISEGTVKQHINAIFRELSVKNRTQATLVAKKHL
jgi:DNA-binding NarL/FixJ family response regulator